MPLRLAIATSIGFKNMNPRRPGKKNNQDAFAVRPLGAATDSRVPPEVVVIADGCGTQPNSHVGAQMGADLFAELFWRELKAVRSVRKIDARRIEQQGLAEITRVVRRSHVGRGATKQEFDDALRRTFLFTVLVFVSDGKELRIFSIADGVYEIGQGIEEFPMHPEMQKANSPPYIVYQLMDVPYSQRADLRPWLHFRELCCMPIQKIPKWGLMMGSDGSNDVLQDEDIKGFYGAAHQGSAALQGWLDHEMRDAPDNPRWQNLKAGDDITVCVVMLV